MAALADYADIQPAGPEDFDELKRVLDAANDYSVAVSGLKSWNDMEKTYADLRQLVEAGACYVIRNSDGSITSTIAISEHSPYWGETGKDNQALYFHKLLKDPATAKPGEGLRLIGFAAAESQRRQKVLVRCDTGDYQGGLIGYYSRLGFEHRGSFTYPTTGIGGVLLETQAASLLKHIKATADA